MQLGTKTIILIKSHYTYVFLSDKFEKLKKISLLLSLEFIPKLLEKYRFIPKLILPS